MGTREYKAGGGWTWPCDGLVSQPGEGERAELLLATLCYGNQTKLWLYGPFSQMQTQLYPEGYSSPSHVNLEHFAMFI